ncbi:hypothetical protein WA158_005576 [Blastocystis sp. Blastoise]
MQVNTNEDQNTEKKRNEISDVRRCRFCIIIIMVIPPLMLAFSLLSLTRYSERVGNIIIYNGLVVDWNITRETLFSNHTFTIYLNDTVVSLLPIETPDGSYWPVRDSCKLEDDPDGGCIETVPYYLKGTGTLSITQTTLRLYDNDNMIYNETIDTEKKDYIHLSNLDCDENEQKCISQCNHYNGQWNGTICIVYTYLENICYRVIKTENGFIVDQSNVLGLRGQSGTGCEYSDGGWASEKYSENKTKTMTARIRYYKDPYIIASNYTKGCSSYYMNNKQCFGNSVKQIQNDEIYWYIQIPNKVNPIKITSTQMIPTIDMIPQETSTSSQSTTSNLYINPYINSYTTTTDSLYTNSYATPI